MNENYEAICRGEQIRANLIELKKMCRDPKVAASLLEGELDPGVIAGLLNNDDAKVRKNAALLLGELGVQEDVEALYSAYQNETTRFVRSAYLTAMKALDVTDFIDSLQERYDELLAYEPREEERKHVVEERGLLQQLLSQNGVIEKHTFQGWKLKCDVIFTTERSLRESLKRRLEFMTHNGVQVTMHPLGVMVRTNELGHLSRLHAYREVLHALNLKQTISGTPEELAQALSASNMLQVIEGNHKEPGPFYFRIELKGSMELSAKSVFTKKLAAALELQTNGKLLNSTSDYEIELRLVQVKDKEGMTGYYPCLKFYTMEDHRFDWRQETISASMHPSLAAALIELAKPYLSERSVVLDAFCGVGTFVIERNLRMKAYDNYGVDIFGTAIEGARINAKNAGVKCNFVMKDFLEFTSAHPMDEIFADMPVHSKKTKREVDVFYTVFFNRVVNLLAPGGHLFLYSNEEGFVKKNLRLHYDLRLLREYEIRPKDAAGFYIIEKK